jgi:hypothetical protein
MSQYDNILSKIGTFKTLTDKELTDIQVKTALDKPTILTKYQWFYAHIGKWSEQLDTREKWLDYVVSYLKGEMDKTVKDWGNPPMLR